MRRGQWLQVSTDMQKNSAFCSICTTNYTPYSGLLSLSLKNAGQNETHYVLIVDFEEKYREVIKKFEFHPVFMSELLIPGVDKLIEKYTVFELVNVLKPFFMEWLLKKHPEINKLVYLDADTYVYAPLNEIFDYLDKNSRISVALTPHVCDYKASIAISDYSIEQLLFKYGLFNGGFYAIKNDQNALEFFDWHKRKLSKFGFNNLDLCMFADQKILDFAPLLFEFVGIFRNKSYNVAFWNYFEREIEFKNSSYYIENKKLVFFHFSNLRIDEQDMNNSNLAYLSLRNKKVLQKMCFGYWMNLKKLGYDKIITIGYRYKNRYKKPSLLVQTPSK